MKRAAQIPGTPADETINIIDLWSKRKYDEAVDAILHMAPSDMNIFIPTILELIENENPISVLSRFAPNVASPTMITADKAVSSWQHEMRNMLKEKDHENRRVEQSLKSVQAQMPGSLLADYIEVVLSMAVGGDDDDFSKLKDIMIPAAQVLYNYNLDDITPSLRMAASHDHAEALWEVYQESLIDEHTSEEEKARMLNRLHKLGNDTATLLLAVKMYGRDPRKSHSLLLYAATLGSIGAYIELAKEYAYGYPGVHSQDMRTAEAWAVGALNNSVNGSVTYDRAIKFIRTLRPNRLL